MVKIGLVLSGGMVKGAYQIGVLKAIQEFIKKETLSLQIVKKDNIEKSYDLNGHETYIELEKK